MDNQKNIFNIQSINKFRQLVINHMNQKFKTSLCEKLNNALVFTLFALTQSTNN